MEARSVISVENVSKDFQYSRRKSLTVKGIFTNIFSKKQQNEKLIQHALKNISFEVKEGEFLGIVGRNGSGKSTMLKMLAGIYQPNKGSVHVHGKLVPFIELGVGFNPELTGRENVYMNGALLNFSEKEVDKFYHEVVEFAELEKFMDKKLKNYSSGMQVRLAFSMAIRAKADILLIDEVLAVGDADFQHKCFNYFRQLKKEHTTVVFVSHDMSSVREYCDRVILIDKGKITSSGSPNKVADEYTKLFIQERPAGDAMGGEKNRQGSGTVIVQNIQDVPVVSGKETPVVLSFDVKATQDVDKISVGFRCKNAADEPMLGTNTTIEQNPILHMQAGEHRRVTFTIPNVFNNGTYFFDILVEGADGEMYDWITDAVSMDVKTEKKTGYLVEVPIRTEVTHA